MNDGPAVFIAGAGGWGTALACVIAERAATLEMWSFEADHAEEMQQSRQNQRFLPGIELPSKLSVTASLGGVAGADVLILVTPSKGVRSTLEAIRDVGLRKETIIVTCTKGIEFSTGYRMSQIVEEVLPENQVVALSGPSHAEEVALQIPTAVVVGGREQAVTVEMQQLISTPKLRIYSSDDIAGVELGGALKNIFALGAGIGDGLGLGDNSKAALVTRSLAEMIRLGTAMGGRPETFQGLSGIGDLMVTCFSRHSRNRGFGERLGKGESVADIEKSTNMVAEGVPTTRSALACAERLRVDCPVTQQINAILEGQMAARDAISELMSRELKSE